MLALSVFAGVTTLGKAVAPFSLISDETLDCVLGGRMMRTNSKILLTRW